MNIVSPSSGAANSLQRKRAALLKSRPTSRARTPLALRIWHRQSDRCMRAACGAVSLSNLTLAESGSRTPSWRFVRGTAPRIETKQKILPCRWLPKTPLGSSDLGRMRNQQQAARNGELVIGKRRNVCLSSDACGVFCGKPQKKTPNVAKSNPRSWAQKLMPVVSPGHPLCQNTVEGDTRGVKKGPPKPGRRIKSPAPPPLDKKVENRRRCRPEGPPNCLRPPPKMPERFLRRPRRKVEKEKKASAPLRRWQRSLRRPATNRPLLKMPGSHGPSSPRGGQEDPRKSENPWPNLNEKPSLPPIRLTGALPRSAPSSYHRIGRCKTPRIWNSDP